MPKRRLQQIANAHRRQLLLFTAGFKPHEIWFVELKLGRFFDQDNAISLRKE